MSFGEDITELVELSRDPLVAKAAAWPRIPLGEVAEILNGFPWKSDRFSKSGCVSLIRIRDVTTGGTETYYDGPITDGYWVESGDILVGMDGDFNVRRWQSEKGLLNQRVCKITPDPDRFDTRLLEYLLPGYLRLINQATSSVTVKHLSSRTLAELPLPLPPLAEQRRIVAKLDALTARLARARAELDRVAVLAEAMRLSALRTSFHWDEDPASLPSGWTRKRIDEVGSVQLGRQRSPKDHTGPHMRPYMRSANITWSGWQLSDVKEMNFSPAEFQTFNLQRGDVLLNEGSGSAKEVGKPAIWNGEIEGACFQNTLLRIRPTGYLPQLLRYCLLYVALSGQFIRNTQGVNIIHIGKAGLAKTIIPVPPQDQQVRLLETLDVAFARADRLKTEAARARALLDRLESAILAKAFRGELVLHDPNDEPAQILLARIRQQRAAAPQAKRGRKAKA